MQISKHRFLYMGISLVIIMVGIILIATMGLNLGLDFSGGSIITVDMGGEFEVEAVEQVLKDNEVSDAPVQKSSASGEVDNFAIIRIKPLGDDAQEMAMRDVLLAGIQETYPDATLESVDMVGTSAIMHLIKSALYSLGIAGALILIYITIRFELFSGLSAVLCLVHDVAIMLAFVAITRLEVNSNLIAGVLTIVGYSINNTIVVFDRIRENQVTYPRQTMDVLVDRSIKDTFTRSMYTSLTTLITIGALYILGADSIKNFALPIIVGLVAGTYSSMVIAGPLWSLLLGKRKKINRA